MKGKSMAVWGALIADTFQEAKARWLFWGLFLLSSMLIAIFLFALNIDLATGAVTFFNSDRPASSSGDVERFVHQATAWVAVFLYIWGTFLAIFASSGLIPSVLEQGRVSLLLSKPVSRPVLLLGRYAGNLLVVAVNHIYLVTSIWIILGLKTHIWNPRFLLAIPIALFIFAVLLAAVVLVGVFSESAALSVMVAVALMLLSTLLAQRQVVVRLLSSEWSRSLWQGFYWILPKVYDLGYAMKQLVMFDKSGNWWTPVWTSFLFLTFVLWSAVRLFEKKDY